jgi:hypothetical protein
MRDLRDITDDFRRSGLKSVSGDLREIAGHIFWIAVWLFFFWLGWSAADAPESPGALPILRFYVLTGATAATLFFWWLRQLGKKPSERDPGG